MEWSVLLVFTGIALTMILLPGPDWVFVLAAGARDRVIAPAVGGLMIGYVLITSAIALGVGPLVEAVPAFLVILTLAGGAYLIYLGFGIMRSAGDRSKTADDVNTASQLTSPSAGSFIRRGIGVTALNPKALLFFLAILPQFTRTTAPWPLPLQLATLGLIYIAIGAIFYLLLGLASDRVFGTRPRLGSVITRIAGGAMIVVGALLLLEQAAQAAGITG